MAEIKRLVVAEAEITANGALIIQFNEYFRPGARRVLFTPEALFELARECSYWPKDVRPEPFPDIPIVTEDSLEDDEEFDCLD